MVEGPKAHGLARVSAEEKWNVLGLNGLGETDVGSGGISFLFWGFVW